MFFRYSALKILLATFFMLTMVPFCANADTVFLKNGMKFTSARVWEENGEIKCYLNKLVVGFPKQDVARIEKAPPEAAETLEPATAIDLEYDLAAAKNKLDQKKSALDLEYQALMQEVERLTSGKNSQPSGGEADKRIERILRHNQKISEFEHKKKAFDIEVQTYQKQIEKENLRQLLDAEKFSENIRSWLHQPVDDFIAAWGYPDQITNMPDGNKRYLFEITITPELSRQIIFDVNQSGRIVTFQTLNAKNKHGLEK